MKANELRIGNLVVEKGRSPFAIDIEKICDFANGFYKFEPIELTDEWLIKFGLDNEVKLCFFSVDKLFIFEYKYNDYTETTLLHIDNKPLPNIKYVHQLQNIYYAVTGTDYPCDLTLK